MAYGWSAGVAAPPSPNTLCSTLPPTQRNPVAVRLVPRDDNVHAMLGALAERALAGVEELGAFLSVDPEQRPDALERILRVELDGAEERHALLHKVARSFVVPIDVEDVHALALALSDCLARVRAAADLATATGAVVPEDVPALVRPLGRMAELTVAAMPRLRTAEVLGDHCTEMHRLRAEAERAYALLVGSALGPGASDPLAALRATALADGLLAVAGAFVRVAERVEVVALKGS